MSGLLTDIQMLTWGNDTNHCTSVNYILLYLLLYYDWAAHSVIYQNKVLNNYKLFF